MKIMKIFLIILVVALAVFAIAQAFITKNVSNTEKYKYEVLEDFGDFEIRKYAPAIFSTVEINADNYKEASGSGFRVLAGYIFGDNERDQKIAMTSPVIMDFDNSSKMMFMVPSEYAMKDLPEPNNPDIRFESHESKIMAAVTFGGWANDEKIEKHRRQLSALLQEKGIEHKGNFLFLGYSPPFEMVNRKNEVVVELSGDYQ